MEKRNAHPLPQAHPPAGCQTNIKAQSGLSSCLGLVLSVGCVQWMTSVQPDAATAVAAAAAATYLSSQKPRGSPVYRGKKPEKIHQHRPSMATQTTASCTGSTLLQPISEIINLPLDQVCFRMEHNPCLICAFCGKRHSILFKTELARPAQNVSRGW